MSFPAKLYLDEEDRRTDRRPVGAGKKLRWPGLASLDVYVVDVSRLGFKFVTNTPIADGTIVHLGLPDLTECRAVVRWRRNAHVGCEFIRPLTGRQVDSLQDQQPEPLSAPALPVTRTMAGPNFDIRPAQITMGLLSLALAIDVLDNWIG